MVGSLILEGPATDNEYGFRWSGFILMNIGETGNFISYAFAPASVVAPLGTVSAFCQLFPSLLIEITVCTHR